MFQLLGIALAMGISSKMEEEGVESYNRHEMMTKVISTANEIDSKMGPAGFMVAMCLKDKEYTQDSVIKDIMDACDEVEEQKKIASECKTPEEFRDAMIEREEIKKNNTAAGEILDRIICKGE